MVLLTMIVAITREKEVQGWIFAIPRGPERTVSSFGILLFPISMGVLMNRGSNVSTEQEVLTYSTDRKSVE